MAKYRLTDNGVQDRDTGAFIPASSGNRNWIEYQKWLDEGNTPDPQFTNEQLATNKRNAFNQEREERLRSGVVTYDGEDYSTDARSRENLSGVVAYVAGGGTLPSGFTWRTIDNQDIAMDSAKLLGLSAAIVDYVNTTYAESWDLKAQVDALDTEAPDFQDQLDAIVWT